MHPKFHSYSTSVSAIRYNQFKFNKKTLKLEMQLLNYFEEKIGKKKIFECEIFNDFSKYQNKIDLYSGSSSAEEQLDFYSAWVETIENKKNIEVPKNIESLEVIASS